MAVRRLNGVLALIYFRAEAEDNLLGVLVANDNLDGGIGGDSLSIENGVDTFRAETEKVLWRC